MLDLIENPFIPGKPISRNIPLERYLPPISEGVVNAWLVDHLQPGNWVLDPYGSHPWLPVEAARAGYPVLMACNNPIIRLVTELLAAPPTIQEYQSAISELLTLKRGEMRLEQTLQAIYETSCPSCGSAIQAESFLWRKDEEEPFGKKINCPNCGETGEKKLSLEDKERLRLVGNEPLFWRRAINRVALEGEDIAELIGEAIKVYLPRQLYFLMTVLNKSESISIGGRKKKLIQAMLLHLFDKGNILWNWPVSRTRPKSLVSPSQFREDNLWLEILNSHRNWASESPSVEISLWPQFPNRSGICIFPGRLRDLPDLSGLVDIKAILAAIPRPNQAFWTLSAIWSGWLWGRDSVTPLKSAIERRRYDWKWHTYALHSVNASLTRQIRDNLRYFAIIPELVPRFFASVLASSGSTGFQISGISYRDQEAESQITWEVSGSKSVKGNILLGSLCEYALSKIIAKTNEPLSFNQLHASFFATLAHHKYFEKKDPQELSLQIDQAESVMQKILGDTSIYRRFGSESQTLDSGLFWPRENTNYEIPPLSDRVEAEIFSFVEQNQKVNLEDTENLICLRFPGITTPSQALIKECLESYCTHFPPENIYEFNQKELHDIRENEISALKSEIARLGEKFGFNCKTTQPLQWTNPQGQVVCEFHLTSYANISQFLLRSEANNTVSGTKKILVFPASRSALLTFKLRRDQRAAEIASKWKLIKFRHLRRILGWDAITFQIFTELLDKDPVLFDESTQPLIFDLPTH